MNTDLSATNVATYNETGFLVRRSFLDRNEVESLCDSVMTAIKKMGLERVAGNPELALHTPYVDPIIDQRVNLWKIDDRIRAVFHAPVLGEMLRALSGVAALRVWHDQTFFKPPGARGLAFHHDVGSWSFSDPNAIQVWVALDAADDSSGCLQYLPGSHHLISPAVTAPLRGPKHELFDAVPALAAIEPIHVEVEPGDAVFHSALTVHASTANESDSWRRAMTCQYMPDGAAFDGTRSVLTSAALSSLSIGDPLDDERNYPLVAGR